jgi:hypothetical protein
VRRFQKVGRTLTNDYAGRHGVPGCDAWIDRPIRNTKVIDSIHFTLNWVQNLASTLLLFNPLREK